MSKKKEYPRHEIKTIEDLSKIVTEKNADMIIGNLYACVKMYLQIKEEDDRFQLTSFIWIDDGKIEIKEGSFSTSRRFKIGVTKKKVPKKK